MERIVIVCYRPKPGKEKALEILVRNHVPTLRKEGLATEREPVMMKAADGTIIEVFGWKSKEAIQSAHSNPAVQTMWAEFEKACEYEVAANINELTGMFSEFSPL
jgi:quinol monooxygenase YgiN